MAIIVEGSKPFSAGPGINIDGDKVISVLLRAEDNLIKLNSNDELYTDLQFASGLEPEDDLPVGITVGKVLEEDGRDQNGLLINWKTTSGDYARWIYGADGKIYFDGGQGTWKQVYYSQEVDALFTALRGELSTVAFTGDYNDLRNRPVIVNPNDGELTISKNGEPVGIFTANQATDETINIEVPTTVAELEDASDYAKTADLSTVATTGDYDDLLDKPTIGDATITIKKNNTTVDSFTTNDTSNKSINITVPTTVAELTDSSDYVTDTELYNALADYTPTANLAAVALSNDYDDLDDKPTIGDATLTIQKNGTTVNSIKMNATTDVTANIVVPTDTSELTNNAGFVTNQVNDTAYGSSWDGVTDKAPSKNAVYDKINGIDGLIPSAATTSNQLADKNYVNDSINSVTAYYITKNAQGDAFATYAELSSATTFYSGGVARTPTRNDYCIVLADENHSNEVTRYSYQGTQWEYQYTVNESPMSQAQLDALNSGITSTKVGQYDTAVSTIAGYGDIVTHDVSEFATAAQGGLADTAVQPGDLATVATTGAYSDLSGTPNLATVATSGSYADLSNKPTIPTVSDAAYGSSWDGETTSAPSKNAVYDKISAMDTTISGKADSSSLATVATSGSYNDLSNKPTIPAAQVNSDWDATSGVAQILNKPTLATVATSGSYNDLSNKPTIPAAQIQSDWTQADNTKKDYIKNKPSLATVATSGLYSDLSGTPTLATVATSGSYNDLSNKPTIPTVNNATLTIQKNGTTVKTFTANASTDVTANISVPTKTSDISNDSGYITKSVNNLDNYTLSSALATVATTGSYSDLSNKPTIPTDTSDLTNGAGFITGITSGDVTTALGYTPQKQHTTLTLTLTTGGWSGNTQSVTATGVTASNTVVISPAPSSLADYTSAVIYCSAQGSNSLTFTCTNEPTSDITVNVLILN